jgi:hypothetical protein
MIWSMRNYLRMPRYNVAGLLGAVILVGIIAAVLVLTHIGHHPQRTYYIHQ